ncbi:Sec-independent protein translocase protein TatB [Thiomicrorhabdus sp. 6S3-12]|uniref:Sec-independent protein translocase protein TatB n=1 Tax=Thiomicrorhabdus sp. 6S3-12 TaxID=2819681 RepID=UPI001AACC01C|nr:Sec-independent protein translocase protein TatB [Thiomicrorhabdus sp. 6S3-12]MBO1924676.1 twin-arginine translocase subunit TatB [Thiomicrorhabdus sp. 6S3-12]
MFDIGFLELLMIMIIALIVIGPERMPEVARKLGSFMGKTRRFIESVKQENHVQETINDFKQSVNLEAEKEKLDNLHNDLQESLNVGIEQSKVDDFNLDEFERPFGGSNDSGSSFNRAPSQPKVPGATSEDNNVAAQSSSDAQNTESRPQAAEEATKPTSSTPASSSPASSTASSENSTTPVASDSSKS